MSGTHMIRYCNGKKKVYEGSGVSIIIDALTRLNSTSIKSTLKDLKKQNEENIYKGTKDIDLIEVESALEDELKARRKVD